MERNFLKIRKSTGITQTQHINEFILREMLNRIGTVQESDTTDDAMKY